MADADPHVRVGKEGNRWYNERPMGEEVATWFAGAIDFPEGLKPENYVAGVVMIPGKEKANEPWGFNSDGLPVWREVENLVFSPYIKVETRIQYFHDLMKLNEDELLGSITPVAPLVVDKTLPPGFQRLRVASKDGDVPFVTATMKVTVYKRSSVERRQVRNTQTGKIEVVLEGETVIDAAPATKVVPVLTRWKSADPHALEKAETGAVGRALGMAGMLVIPGTGVATAEDMQQALSQEVVASDAGAEAPPAAEGSAARDVSLAPSHDELVALVSSTIAQLKEADKAAHTAFLAWVGERGFLADGKKLPELKDEAIKQILKKAEGDLAVVEGKGAAPDAS